MPRYVDLDNPKIIRAERDMFGLVVYHIPPDTPCLNLAERKKGEWIEYINSHCECPFCHKEWSYFDNEVEYFDFCPKCGADLRGEQDDNRRV